LEELEGGSWEHRDGTLVRGIREVSREKGKGTEAVRKEWGGGEHGKGT